MLTAYLDESSGTGDGFFVIGGFFGNDDQWKRLRRAWRRALRGRPSLHMASLRLGSRSGATRHKELLEELGSIPARCGLVGVYGSVRSGDYDDLVEGKVSQIPMGGYALALWPAVTAILNLVPPHQRVKLVFEQQKEHAAIREIVLSEITSMVKYRTSSGRSKLVGWESVSDNTMLEPADYYCYAVLQHEINPNSPKSKLCSPIFTPNNNYGSHMDRNYARSLVALMEQQLGGIPNIDKRGKKETLRELREHSAAKDYLITESDRFDQAMDTLLKADPRSVKKAQSILKLT